MFDDQVRCDRSDHNHSSLEEARQCYRDEHAVKADVEVTPDQDAVKFAMEAHAESVKAAQSKARKANGTAKAAQLKPVAKPSAAKPLAAKPPKATSAKKPEVKRVPAETFIAEVKRHGLSFTQAAKALGLSPSSIVEFCGKGRGRLMAADRWPEAKAKIAEFAKANKPK